MNKSQLIDAVAEETGLSKAEAARSVDATLNIITKALIQREQVAIAGFGAFGAKKRAARTGRDPRSGKVLQIPESTVAFFKPGKALKDAVNEAVVEAS